MPSIYNKFLNENESLGDLYSKVNDLIKEFQSLKQIEIDLDPKLLEYYEMFYSDSITSSELITILDIDIKDWDLEIGSSDEYIKLFGKDDSQGEKDLLKKMKENASILVSYRQIVLLKALEDLMNLG